MKVVFWGGETGSGTTSNMRVFEEVFAHNAERERRGIYRKVPDTFADCGCSRDDHTKQMLRKADVVVVNVRQSGHMLDEFFLDAEGNYTHCFFLISSYFKNSAYNRQRVEQIYRINPGQLGVVPYNSEFRYACERGKQKHFMKSGYADNWKSSQQNRDFFQSVKRAAYDLRKYMDEIEGGTFYGNRI